MDTVGDQIQVNGVSCVSTRHLISLFGLDSGEGINVFSCLTVVKDICFFFKER